MSLGQDRYRRRYWILPKCGGVFVEGLESGEPESIDPAGHPDSLRARAAMWAETCANDVIQGQISGAPEPASWALMMFAVGLIGQILRRRPRSALA